MAHVSGHLDSLDHSTRERARSHRTRRTMLLVVTVAGWLTLEVMTLHRSCETFSAAYSSDVNAVANGELVDGDFLANLKGIDRIEADFDESASWLNPAFA